MSHTQNHNNSPANNFRPKSLAVWLFFCAFMVFAMMVIGAITRLTESGLSMVEWRPLIGALPPMNDAEWNRVFDLYQQSPEYQKKNAWMGIADFKNIFFWEWFHRLWGRLIGIAFALPLIWFFLRRNIPTGYGLKLFGLLILGGMQGLMGWYMVKSGLVDMPAVSHFRLAAHLSLAMLIFALLIYTALSVLGIKKRPQTALYRHAWGALAIISTTIIWGAFTAGLDAGLLYNDSFPQMGGAIIPPDFHQYPQIWLNALHNPSGVQFIHRWLAISTLVAVASLWAHAILVRRHHFAAMHALGGVVLVQFGLGLATLFSNVHLHTAATHQAGAVTLLGVMMVVLYKLRAARI